MKRNDLLKNTNSMLDNQRQRELSLDDPNDPKLYEEDLADINQEIDMNCEEHEYDDHSYNTSPKYTYTHEEINKKQTCDGLNSMTIVDSTNICLSTKKIKSDDFIAPKEFKDEIIGSNLENEPENVLRDWRNTTNPQNTNLKNSSLVKDGIEHTLVRKNETFLQTENKRQERKICAQNDFLVEKYYNTLKKETWLSQNSNKVTGEKLRSTSCRPSAVSTNTKQFPQNMSLSQKSDCNPPVDRTSKFNYRDGWRNDQNLKDKCIISPNGTANIPHKNTFHKFNHLINHRSKENQENVHLREKYLPKSKKIGDSNLMAGQNIMNSLNQKVDKKNIYDQNFRNYISNFNMKVMPRADNIPPPIDDIRKGSINTNNEIKQGQMNNSYSEFKRTKSEEVSNRNGNHEFPINRIMNKNGTTTSNSTFIGGSDNQSDYYNRNIHQNENKRWNTMPINMQDKQRHLMEMARRPLNYGRNDFNRSRFYMHDNEFDRRAQKLEDETYFHPFAKIREGHARQSSFQHAKNFKRTQPNGRFYYQNNVKNFPRRPSEDNRRTIKTVYDEITDSEEVILYEAALGLVKLSKSMRTNK